MLVARHDIAHDRARGVSEMDDAVHTYSCRDTPVTTIPVRRYVSACHPLAPGLSPSFRIS